MNTSTHFRCDIQGLRALAVLLVIAHHYSPELLPGGFIGVDVFFVISGYLITSILLQKKSSADYRLSETLAYFYKSRFKRIAPAYFLMLSLVFILASVFFIPKDYAVFSDALKKALYFGSNDYFASFGEYFAPSVKERPLLHTWSLAIEIQFYILIPFLILLLPRRYLVWGLFLLIIMLLAISQYRLSFLGEEQETYYSLSARLPEFFVGCLAAINMLSAKNLSIKYAATMGVVLILFSSMLQPFLGVFPGVLMMIPVIGGVFVLISSSEDPITRLLSSNIMVWLGGISYSLYLWHWPILALMRYYSESEDVSPYLSVLFVVLTLLLSVLSYYLIELPFRKNVVIRGKSLVVLLSGVTVVAFSVFFGGKLNDLFSPETMSPKYQRYADYKNICHGHMVSDCLIGDVNSDREILVVGDSHAAMLNYFFDDLGVNNSFKARVITASSCLTIDGFDVEKLPRWARQACSKQIIEATQKIKEADIIILAGMWSYQLESNDTRDAILNYMHGLCSDHKKLYVLPQIPLLNSSPIRALRFNWLGFGSNSMNIDEVDYYNSIMKSYVSKYSCSKFIDLPFNEVFNQGAFVDDVLLYFDESHLNEIGIAYYFRRFGADVYDYLNF